MDRYRKRRFAKNLDALLTARCVTRKEAATEAGVPYQWLRRAVTDGISRPDKRSRDHLDALIRYFGLDGVDRLWDRDLYVPPPPSSIKHEADRLAELMREYVLAAGAGDEFLRQIVAHLERVVSEERVRQERASEERERQRRAEELDAAIAGSYEKLGNLEALESWRERRDRLRREEEERGREREERAKSFREAEERLRAASRVLDLFRLEVVERWRSVGLPRVEEVELPVAEVVALADEHRLKSPQELAPHVSDLWLEKYAHVLGETPGQARDSIREFVSSAFGRVGEWGTASGDEAGASSQDLTGGSDSDAVGSPWWRTSYVPPPPSSIKDEADRIGEELREYVRLVGEGDAVLRGIVEQIRVAVRAHGLKAQEAAPEASTGAGQSPPPAAGRPQTVAEKAAEVRRAIAQARQERSLRAADGDRGIRARPHERAGRADSPSPGSGPSYPTLARQALDELEAERLGGWRAYRLPRIDEVVVTPEELAEHAGALGLTPDELASYALKVVWLPKYARLLGVTVDEATRFIKDHLAGYVPGGGDGTAQPQPAQAAGGGAGSVRDAGEDVAEDAARTAARPLVARVLGLLSPEQADFFLRGYPSPRRAECDLEDDLFRRILVGDHTEGQALLPQSPDEAVRAIVAGIAGDFEKSRHAQDDGGRGHLDDEPGDLVAPDKSLDFRHGDDVTPEIEPDHRSVPPPVGIALEEEIARSIAEDREAVGRRADEILETLGDLPLPAGGGTYLDRLKLLGQPRAVAAGALREAEGDLGKALKRLVDRIDGSLGAERPGRRPRMQDGPARRGGRGPARARPPKKGRSDEMRPEDLRRFVVTAHEDGLGLREIVLALREDVENLPEWLRSRSKAELAEIVVDLLPGDEADGDEPLPGDFDPEARDEKRAWEMGYEGELDAR